MDFFVSLLPQISNLILFVVAVLTLVFLVVFFRKYQASRKGLGEAIQGLESKLGNHNGRDTWPNTPPSTYAPACPKSTAANWWM